MYIVKLQLLGFPCRKHQSVILSTHTQLTYLTTQSHIMLVEVPKWQTADDAVLLRESLGLVITKIIIERSRSAVISGCETVEVGTETAAFKVRVDGRNLGQS